MALIKPVNNFSAPYRVEESQKLTNGEETRKRNGCVLARGRVCGKAAPVGCRDGGGRSVRVGGCSVAYVRYECTRHIYR